MPLVSLTFKKEMKGEAFTPSWNKGENICIIKEVIEPSDDFDEYGKKQLELKYANHHHPDMKWKSHWIVLDREDAHDDHPKFSKGKVQNVEIEMEGLLTLLNMTGLVKGNPGQVGLETEKLVGKTIGVWMEQPTHKDGRINQYQDKETGEWRNKPAEPINGRRTFFVPTELQLKDPTALKTIKKAEQASEKPASEPTKVPDLDDEIPF